MGVSVLSKTRMLFEKPQRGTKDKLTIYTMSALFSQLVWFKELVSSMYAFVGVNQSSKVDTIFKCIRQVIESMLQTLMVDRHDYELQVKRITDGIEKLDIKLNQLAVKSLYPRLIKVELMINSPPKELTLLGIQTVLEGILNEPLRLVVDKSKGSMTRVKVYSSNCYKVNYGMSYVGKNGSKVSGDSYVYEDFANGQTCIALSDGMGNGEEAHEESSQALNILKGLLLFHFSVTEAIETLQQLKSSANANERFFSIDVCMIDRERQKATFYKKGATPTFIIRDNKIKMIELEQLPIGVMIEQEIDAVKVDLHENDVIIMCSDGIFEQYPNIDDLKALMLTLQNQPPKILSTLLLHSTIEKGKGKIKDDMMVIAMSYKKQLTVAA